MGKANYQKNLKKSTPQKIMMGNFVIFSPVLPFY
jgi:hypothetical protein